MATSGEALVDSGMDLQLGAPHRLTRMAAAGNFVSFATAIADVLLILPKRMTDNRGYFAETYNAEDFAALGIQTRFVQDNQSLSAARGTVRGLHYQLEPAAQAKLIRVVRGSILDVAVDLRRGSATFGQHAKALLDETSFHQLYIPVGFAHGFVTLEPDTEVLYKVSSYYSPEHEGGIAFDDPALGIEWGISRAEAVMSERDKCYPALADARELF
jgi:dTDP-4-dehydrorhamnose 3,5-epimerase